VLVAFEQVYCDDVGREIDADVPQGDRLLRRGDLPRVPRSANLQDLAEVVDEFEGPALDFIRAAAWAFLRAWVLRYGGLFERLRVSGTLIDPSRNDPTA
jgi:hypothetical protein